MAVERIDVQIASLVSGAQQAAAKHAEKGDEADAVRRQVEKKAEQKKLELKNNVSTRETFGRDQANNQRFQQLMQGAQGPDVARSLGQWQSNKDLQARLTDAQRKHFQEAVVQNPPRGAEAGAALNRIAQTPGFPQAVNQAPIMATVQHAVLQNPAATEKPVMEMLQNRFMQTAKADPKVKNDFMRFGLQNAQRGGTADTTRRAGDLLGSLAQMSMPAPTQRAAMAMIQRATDGKPLVQVDQFVQQPGIQRLPNFARGKATELLAKADGDKLVSEGFVEVANHPRFRSQTTTNKGRFFSTIGTGRPSEYRALTDKALVALQNPGFPKRAGQVSKFLGQMAAQVQRGGAASVEVETLVKQSKLSALPKAPVMGSTAGLSDDDANKVRSQNRAKVIQFYTQLQRVYEHAEKKLGTAKYYEDVSSLANLRKPEGIDTSKLSPEERTLVEGKQEQLDQKLDSLQKLQRQKARELRTSRMPPAKRRAQQAEQRRVGRQPKYFSPRANATGAKATEVFREAASATTPQGLPQTPMRGQLSQRAQQHTMGGGAPDIQAHVAQVVAQLGSGPLTPQRAGQVAQAIASQVAQQVAQQVTQQLLGLGTPQEMATPQPMAREASGPRQTQQGKVDGWGVPRSFERDLGGAQHAVVRPRDAHEPDVELAATAGQPPVSAPEVYTGRTIVKDASAIRLFAELFGFSWKQMTKAETALLKNLGWSQRDWDTKETPAAKWPMSMATPFMSLTPAQRESVRKLGFSAPEWDKRVQGLMMGKNA